MLVTADWVVPVASAPIREGGVLIDGDRIVSVGPKQVLAKHLLASEHEHFAGCIITPGLVNAHTHLTLSALHGVIPSQPFAEWLGKIVPALRPWSVEDHEASGVVGAEECLLAGVTVAGDIAYGAAEVSKAAAAGLGGVFYWELLGMKPEDIEEHLDYLRYPSDPGMYGERVICGLSPHAPYTSGPGLIRGVHAKARALAVPSAIHVAESTAEVQLLLDGSGPLASVAGRTAFEFAAPGVSTVSYLASLDALEGVTAVHLCHASEEDLGLLASKARGVVTCPRSNQYLVNPPPSVTAMLDAGLVVGVGTDSSASNIDLDLMEEVRAVHRAEPDLGPDRVLSMATLEGARAIGVADRFGSLEAGKFADLSVFAIKAPGDPVVALVEQAGSGSVEAVMSGGVWRVLEGRLLKCDLAASALAADARARSLAALSGP